MRRTAIPALTAALALSVVAPVLAHPAGTTPVAAGESGPYGYEVAIGPYSPLRPELFVAVTLSEGGAPVIDADVTVSARWAGSVHRDGPLEALSAPDHPATYEVYLEVPGPAGREISIEVGVLGRPGRAAIEAAVLVPARPAGAPAPPGPSGSGGWGAVHTALAAGSVAAAAALLAWAVRRRRT